MSREELWEQIRRMNEVWVALNRHGEATLQLWDGPRPFYQHRYGDPEKLAADIALWVREGEIDALPESDLSRAMLVVTTDDIVNGEYTIYALAAFLYPYDRETRDGLGKLVREKINLTEMLEEGLKQ